MSKTQCPMCGKKFKDLELHYKDKKAHDNYELFMYGLAYFASLVSPSGVPR
jgi:hypothetical protein